MVPRRVRTCWELGTAVDLTGRTFLFLPLRKSTSIWFLLNPLRWVEFSIGYCGDHQTSSVHREVVWFVRCNTLWESVLYPFRDFSASRKGTKWSDDLCVTYRSYKYWTTKIRCRLPLIQLMATITKKNHNTTSQDMFLNSPWWCQLTYEKPTKWCLCSICNIWWKH